ncbi:unnamed protein product [Caretta caretta]
MEGLMVNLVNVYAPISGPEQLHFFQQASAFLGTLDPRKCLVLGGDFNNTLEEQDRLGTEQCPATADVLQEIVENHSLVDIWCNQQPDNILTFNFVQQWWDLGKVRARLFCLDYTRSPSRRRDAAIEQLEREVLQLERHLAASPEDPSLYRACQEKQEELWALEEHRARGAFLRSRIHLLREMDHGSRFFYALEKRRGAKKHITCLLAENGTALTDLAEMCRRARVFYAGLFPRIQPILTLAECSDQTYTIPGHTIFDNLYLVQDLLELGCRNGLSFSLLSLDQEKAFDRVDHGRLTGLVLREPELRLGLSAYADNVLLVVQNPGDLAQVEDFQAIYLAASSTWVN